VSDRESRAVAAGGDLNGTVGEIARQSPSTRPRVFPEHWLAHELLDGLTGLEIGAAAHNPFGLETRNVASPEGAEFYAEEQRAMGVEPAPVDIWAVGDHVPVPDRSEDFVLSSHVLEHLPNVIGAFLEWDRIVRPGGYVFLIVPLKGALPQDDARELTPLAHFVECNRRGWTLDTHPTDDVPGGRMGHYHTFTPDSLTDVVDWMRANGLCDWELVAREDVDSKVGNGFTLVFRVMHGERS
jgi:SAM-dependent methyltransferase